jgi:hypothetical protein
MPLGRGQRASIEATVGQPPSSVGIDGRERRGRGGPGALLQTSTLERVTLSPFDLLEVVEREGVVVKRGNVLVHHRLDGGFEGTPLGPTDRWWVTPAVNGRFVAADGLEGRVIELTTGAEISRVEGRVHGLSADGQVLVGPKQATAESRSGGGHYRWPKGLLHWQVPSPSRP